MELISDTVWFFQEQFNMPQMSSKYASIYAANDFIDAQQNTEITRTLVKIGHE